MPTKKKKRYNARFPPARIKKIMQSDEDVGKVAAAVPVIISRALELFVETLMSNVSQSLNQRGARTMTPGHLKICINSEPRFDFLKELVADVAEPQGDHDAESMTDNQNVSSSKTPTTTTTTSSASVASVASIEADSSSMSTQPKLQRQLSASRLRNRLRKSSSDATKPKNSTKRYVDDVDSDQELLPESQNSDSMDTSEPSSLSRLNPKEVDELQSATSNGLNLVMSKGIPEFTITPLPMATASACITKPTSNGGSTNPFSIAMLLENGEKAKDEKSVITVAGSQLEVDEDYDA